MVTAASGVAPATEADVRAILAGVMDPELPVVSIADLGMVGLVVVTPAAIQVDVLPTFLGCPAIEVILDAVRTSLAPLDVPVVARVSHASPWTSDRISEAGRHALASAGIAPPTDAPDPACPWCDSDRTVRDSAFGPTQCRSLHYCRACRQPFEAFRTLR